LCDEMAIEFHEFDRDGDLLLLVGCHFTPNDDAETFTSVDEYTAEDFDVKPTMDHSPVIDDADDTAVENLAMPDSAPEEENDKEVHMLVSSKIMMLASPVFRAMLRNDTFREGKELGSTGKVCLSRNTFFPPHINCFYQPCSKLLALF
jgi:hypothetical protein